MKYIALVLLMFFSSVVYAGAWSDAAIPTRVDIERGNGFMVYGSFGNAGGCTITNRFYVEKAHPQYDEIYATILSAFMANKKITAYISGCNPVTWYAITSTTFNTVTSGGSVNLSN